MAKEAPPTDDAPADPDSANARAEETVTSLVSMLAHELSSPLQALSINVHVTAERVRSAPEVPRAWLLERLEVQRKSTQRLQRLVETFINVAETSRGPLLDATRPSDLRAIVEELIAGARAELAWAGCSCELRAPTPLVGHWDRGKVEMVVGNLVSNAGKYGAGHPVQVELSEHDGAVRISVQDHGPGIAREAQGLIFQKFARLSGGATHPGLGLGLWIVEQFVKAMNGDVEVESAPGQGARFTVTLPWKRESPPPAP